MKLVYWLADNEGDSRCYSIRAKTRKECIALVAESYDPSWYAKPRKVVIEYADAFDLMMQLTSEGGGEWWDGTYGEDTGHSRRKDEES